MTVQNEQVQKGLDLQDAYAMIYRPEEFGDDVLVFFETKEELHALLSELHEKRTKTNQRFSYFSHVFPKGALYPTEYDTFWREARNATRKSYHVGNGYFVQRTLKKGKVKAKYYNFAEDFDWQLDEWKEKGSRDILILDMDESLTGEYYYERDIEKKWGEKEEPLFA